MYDSDLHCTVNVWYWVGLGLLVLDAIVLSCSATHRAVCYCIEGYSIVLCCIALCCIRLVCAVWRRIVLRFFCVVVNRAELYCMMVVCLVLCNIRYWLGLDLIVLDWFVLPCNTANIVVCFFCIGFHCIVLYCAVLYHVVVCCVVLCCVALFGVVGSCVERYCMISLSCTVQCLQLDWIGYDCVALDCIVL